MSIRSAPTPVRDTELTAALNEIRKRYLRRGESPGDIPVLLAEVVKLRGELEHANHAVDEARAETARLRAELTTTTATGVTGVA